MPPLVTAAVAVVGTLVLLAAGFVLSFRFRFRPVLTAIRRLNRRVTNPIQLRGSAGQPGAWASVVHHVGRNSGTPYRTPVVAVPRGDAFAIVLPYGPETDWLRNLEAAGGGVLEHDGDRVAVERPEVVPIEQVDSLFSAREQRSNRSVGLREALILHRSTPVAAATDGHRDTAGGQA
ncbi:nitroreductase family deazaflavin-dependent oxidoreductase [Euzebya sp.]|uniref:nitroreductase family deazaflavin-dependent oxidoreductase n=1 Tax=Euzebya sp. TaxID=1971409 RepID=UPI003513294B